MTATALARTIRRAAARPGSDEHGRCDLCATQLSAEHRHLVDRHGGAVRCACRPCALLFAGPGTVGDYRLIPSRRVRLAEVDPATLGVPVGLAWFVVGEGGEVTAHYPSPLGATRWEVAAEAWEMVRGHCPELSSLVPEVEALLVNTVGAGTGHAAEGVRRHCWLVPVEDCHRLAAIVRHEWRGLSGGGTVWVAIEEFFGALRETS